jgi:hypothetical protein
VKPIDASAMDASHVDEVQLGGRRSPELVVFRELELPDDFDFKTGHPMSRDECRGGQRPCPYVECRFHLWLVDAESRPGRRHHRAQGGAPEAEINPVTMTTCALDISERDDKTLMPFHEIGEVLGVSDERARQLCERAVEKLQALGISVDELFPEEHP